MRLHSQSFPPLGRIASEYAYGVPGSNRPVVDGPNRNPHLSREEIEARLARDLDPELLEGMVRPATLAEVPALGAAILKGQVQGRVVVDVRA